jgi:hypothetical protein
MKLDRNVNGTGRGKYGLVNNRKLLEVLADMSPDQSIYRKERVEDAIAILQNLGILDWGTKGTESEFFVINLRERFAHVALDSYAHVARMSDLEYATDIQDLVNRSGPYSPFCKIPD